MVDDFFAEKKQIKTYEYDAHGMRTERISYPQQLKDAFCLVKIFERLPESVNKGYMGKIRELLLPSLENLSLFDIRKFVDGLKGFEEDPPQRIVCPPSHPFPPSGVSKLIRAGNKT